MRRALLCLLLAACPGPKPAPTLPATQPATEPATQPATQPAEDEFRKAQPAPAELRPFTPPAVERFSVGGVDVYLHERHELPTVTVSLILGGGAVVDAKGKEGLASLCMAVVGDGTKRLNKAAYDEALADLGSSIEPYASPEQLGYHVQTLSDRLDATLDLLAEDYFTPGLRAADFTRRQRQAIAGLEEVKGSPRALARRLATRVQYGPFHGYGRLTTAKTLGAVTLADCQALAADFTPRAVFVAGDVTRADLEAKLGARFAKWKPRPLAPSKLGNPKPLAGRFFLVDLPGSTQSMIVAVAAGPERKAPDYYATQVMISVLANGFTSRINQNLREDKGWTYGAYGAFQYRKVGSLLSIGSQVRADKTGAALAEIVKEVRGIVDADVTADELAREKEGAILQLPSFFDTASQVLSTVFGLVYFELPLDYYAGWIAGFEAVTVESARAAAKEHILPDEIRYVVVGDVASVRPQIEEGQKSGALPAGEIALIDFDGKLSK